MTLLGTFPRRLQLAVVSLGIAALGMVAVPPADAAQGDIGFQGPSFTGVSAPTGEKPESKLWYNDGRWWASMFAPASGAWHIFYLDRSTNPKSWVDSGTAIDNRANTLSDTLWDGGKLYIASHVKATSNTTSQTGQPSRLYRYTYNSTSKSYTLDTGFPNNINNVSSETLTLDRDSTGRLWTTWTQGQQVMVNSTTSNDQWATPSVLPVSNSTGIDPDDISTIVAFGSRIGVLWSSQSNSTVYFSSRTSTDPVTAWSPSVAVTVPGAGQADDHLNIKQVQADPSGRVFAVIKTSLDNSGSSAPQIVVLSRSSTGAWSRATFGTVGDCHTRPILMLDTTNNLVRVYATAPDSGCAFTGSAGTIFEKTSPMSSLSFAAGRGTPVIRDSASLNLNNPTGSKQSVDAGSGVVILASNEVTKKYWFSDESLSSTATAPVAGFTASPTSGAAPLPVQFTDTSTGTPTSWAWDFGDGGMSTTKNAAHTYTQPGTYTVKLTATNAIGSNVATRTGLITVTGSSANITAGAISTAGSSTAINAIALNKPSGTSAGDVLVASITADNNPTMAAVPTGWTPLVNALSVNSAASAGARIFSYYHVVAATDPSSYSWSLSSAQKWSAGVSAYRGVNTATPLASAVVTAVNTSFSGTSLTLPSITTSQSNAMLVGGVGLDSSTPLASPPAGWTQEWQTTTGQVTEQAHKVQAVAGPSGTATWTLSSGRAFGGWQVALRPAG
jgi:PKD repeat protein